MNTSSFLVCVGSAFLLSMTTGCSGGGDAADGDSPVASSALSGSFGGSTFSAVSATASVGFDDDGERRIEIYDSEVTCETFGGGSGRSILVSAPWQEGYASALSLKQNITFYTPPGDNLVATQGRIEIVSAPTEAGQKGKLRLRAFANDDNQVEGEIEVEVCAK